MLGLIVLTTFVPLFQGGRRVLLRQGVAKNEDPLLISPFTRFAMGRKSPTDPERCEEFVNLALAVSERIEPDTHFI